MASSIEFIEYICGQIAQAGEINYRKMFGEYCIYCDGKPVALICDNQFFVKITLEGQKEYPALSSAAPYPGAKPYFLLEDTDDTKMLSALVKLTARHTPAPKKRAKKSTHS